MGVVPDGVVPDGVVQAFRGHVLLLRIGGGVATGGVTSGGVALIILRIGGGVALILRIGGGVAALLVLGVDQAGVDQAGADQAGVDQDGVVPVVLVVPEVPVAAPVAMVAALVGRGDQVVIDHKAAFASVSRKLQKIAHLNVDIYF